MKLGLASNFQDEAENVEQIWNIFKDAVDKWVVVDSGSTDGTQQKLKEIVGDKLTLIEDPMIKSAGYGYSRTKLVEFSEEMDWVLVIDGDERMFPEDIEKLRKLLLTDPPYDMIRLPRCHYQNLEATIVEYGSMDKTGNDWHEALRINSDFQPRLIKRTMIDGQSKVQFYRRVHELTKGIDRELRSLANPVIRHFGWCKTNARKKMVVDLCDQLWQKDKENIELKGTYEKENQSGSSHAWWPEYAKKHGLE